MYGALSLAGFWPGAGGVGGEQVADPLPRRSRAASRRGLQQLITAATARTPPTTGIHFNVCPLTAVGGSWFQGPAAGPKRVRRVRLDPGAT